MMNQEWKVATDQVLLVSTTGHCVELGQDTVNDFLSGGQARFDASSVPLPDALVPLLEMVRQSLAGKRALAGSCVLERSGHYCQARAIPVSAELALLLLQDLTAWEQQRLALQQEKALLQAVLDGSRAEITVLDSHGEVILRNKQALKHQHWNSLQEFLREKESLYTSDGTTPCPEESLPLVRAFRGEAAADQLLVVKSKKGRTKAYLVHAQPLRDASGQLSGALRTSYDVTDTQAMLLRLKTREKDLQTLLYQLSHDLKSPLCVMKGILELACQPGRQPQQVSRFLDLLRLSHEQLYTRVSTLIEASRLSQREVTRSQIEVTSLVRQAIAPIRDMARSQGIRVSVKSPESLRVHTDEVFLRAVVQHLITNAVLHHRSEGGEKRVQLRVFERAETLVLEVRDNGPGMTPGVQACAFDMFFRASSRAPGTGLGLFMVRQAVEKMGGHIQLRSRTGVGSCFCVTLPLIGA